MFQGDSASYTIPSNIAEGTYTYFSPTDPSLAATIRVLGGGGGGAGNQGGNPQNPNFGLPDFGEAESVDAFSFAQQSLLESIQRQLDSDRESIATPEETVAPVVDTSGLPQNPYTVGNEKEFPFDAEGAPVPHAFGDSEEIPLVAANVQNYDPPPFAGAVQKPFRQPDTGPGFWLVLSLSAAGLLYCIRRASPVVRLQ